MKENKYFPYIVAISAISISFSAAFYSIFGIGKMFAGASTNVMVMAASLEFAKLVIASLLYRFWDEINKALKVYLTIACFVLIVITSAGIYGFLSSAYQETANKVENVDKNTAVIEKRKQMIQRQLDQAEKQLELKSTRQNTLSDMRNRQQTNADNLIAQNKSVSSVRSQMNQLSKESKTLDDDIKILQDSIASKTQQINDLDLEILNVSSNNDIANEIGPLKFIAKITGKSLDQVVNWFIIALMLVFDPLAIALVVAANFVFSYVSEKKKIDEAPKNPEPDKTEPDNTEPDKTEIKIEEELEVQAPEEEVSTQEEILGEYKTEEEGISLTLKGFVIGGTPVAESSDIIEENEQKDIPEKIEEAIEKEEGEIISSENTGNNEESKKEDNDIVYSPDLSEVSPDLTPDGIEDEIDDLSENLEEGEFGGYRLGNVYGKERKSIKDYKNKKEIPIDLLVRKEDPTRL
jgi:hypothetical protein